MPPPRKVSAKTRARQDRTAEARRQGAIPCLILVVLGLLVIALFFFYGIKSSV